MKTTIEIKGNNKQARQFANCLMTVIENNPAKYDSVVRLEDKEKFNVISCNFVSYQTDRNGVNIEELIDEAKDFAESEGKDYDEITIIPCEDYSEEDDEYKMHDGEKFHVEETKTTWEIFSNIYEEGNASTSYEKIRYTKKEAIADYRESEIY